MELIPDAGNTLLRGMMKALIEQGTEAFVPVMQALMNEAMKIEREQHVNASAYERTSERKGQCNGFKDKSILTRSGALELKVPQVRDSSFYPNSIEKGVRSEVALKLALAEMYVQGVSTRKVEAITKILCGTDISSTQISRVSRLLDEELQKFRNRPLTSAYPYLFLDAQYQRVRFEGVVRNVAVLIAIGVASDGHREVLGVSVSLSEAEVHWRKFLQSLVERGLSGVRLITSDNHEGLGSARTAVLPSVPWQRCLFHISQNALAYAPNRGLREEIAQAMRDIFSSPTVEDARAMMKKIAKRYEKMAPKFSQWLEENVEDSFTFYLFPRKHWKKIRTSNSLERVNREIKRRTRVATLFPNEESCLRLVTAVLQEIHQEWLTGRVYVDMKD